MTAPGFFPELFWWKAVFSGILKIPEEFPKSVFLRKKYGNV